MAKLRDVRRLALSLPEVIEADHHGRPSFRVAGKIFATIPDEESLNVMLGPDETDLAVGTDPRAYAEQWWGQRLAGVRVTLAKADSRQVDELLILAWRRRAPRKLQERFDASNG